MSDLVKRLRYGTRPVEAWFELCKEAADEIERLLEHQTDVYANGFAAGQASVLDDIREWAEQEGTNSPFNQFLDDIDDYAKDRGLLKNDGHTRSDT